MMFITYQYLYNEKEPVFFGDDEREISNYRDYLNVYFWRKYNKDNNLNVDLSEALGHSDEYHKRVRVRPKRGP